MSEYLWNKTISYERQLTDELDAVDTAAIDPESDAEVCVTMAVSYLEDGRHFLENNDLANALASFSYGHGWLDAGIRMGAIPTDRDTPSERP